MLYFFTLRSICTPNTACNKVKIWLCCYMHGRFKKRQSVAYCQDSRGRRRRYFMLLTGLFLLGIFLVPQEHFSPQSTPLFLQAQPVTFPLAAVLSLHIHCDLQEQFTVEASCKIFIKFNTDCDSISVIFVQNKKQAFTSPDSSEEKSSSSEDISNAISLSSLHNIEPYSSLCTILIIIFA